MTARHFTPREVEALIPALDGLMEQGAARHREATALQQHLRREQERIQASGGGLVDQRDWKARAERLDGLAIEVRQVLEDVQRLGGAVKDLELGLVDFPGLVDGDTVNLCWKRGETRVAFWHGLDEGYAQRKPLR